MKKEDKEILLQMQELFDLAWNINLYSGKPTELSKKATTFLPSIMQQFSFYAERWGKVEDMRRIAWEEGYAKGVMSAIKKEGKEND